jgi:hypothetical protein
MAMTNQDFAQTSFHAALHGNCRSKFHGGLKQRPCENSGSCRYSWTTEPLEPRSGRISPAGAPVFALLGVCLAAWCPRALAQSGANWIAGSNVFNTQDTSLVTSLFDQPTTLWGGVTPSGWTVTPLESFAAYGACTPGCSCNSLTTAVDNGTLPSPSQVPYLMYDDESWCGTPAAEQNDPWDYIKDFTDLAHQYGFKTVIVPALDLFSSGSLGCTQSTWECYLNIEGGAENLTLAQEIGKYSDDYSIQSQANEFNSTYYQFVSQAAAQAIAENPDIVVREGTSTGKTEGYPAARTILAAMDSTRQVQNLVGDWFNVASRPDTGLQVLEMRNGQPVYYAHTDNNMDQVSPSSNTGNSSFSLATTGNSITWITSNQEAFPGGTVIPAGNYDWQYYTDSTSAYSATVSLTVGYCTAGTCSTSEVPITNWSQTVIGGNSSGTGLGFVSQNITSSATTLPSGGPYDIYITATVTSPSSGALDVLYNSGPQGGGDTSDASYPTNLGIPAPIQQPHLVESQVGSFTDGSSGTLTMSLPNPSQNGDRLIVTIAGGSGLTITGPNGWSHSVTADNGTNHAEIWYYYNCPPDVTSATFTYSGANEARGAISEWAGLSTRDVTGSASTGSGTSSTVSTSGATSGTNDLAITAFTEHLSASGTVTMTPGSGWTNLARNDGTTAADHQTFDYKLGTSGTVSETETSSVSGASWLDVIATFKP